MFSATRRWFRRNRTPIAIGIGVVGAGYVVTQYVLSKINDARERMSSDRIAKENLRRRFEQNQEDCTYTVLALLPTATANVLEAMNTEKITYEIQQMKGGSAAARSVKSGSGSMSPPSVGDATSLGDDDGRSLISTQSESGVHASQMALPTPSAVVGEGTQDGGQATAQKRKTKRQLWDDLTMSSITRAYTLVYTVGLLAMLTRIQLNLLGRKSYLSSVVSLATSTARATISLENNDDDNPEQALGSNFEVNRKYLTFSWWLLNRGWARLGQQVEVAVKEVFGHLSPRDQLSFESFSELTRQVRTKVEQDGTSQGDATNWLSFLLPQPAMEDFVLRESGILDGSDSSLSESTESPPSTGELRRLLDETSDLIESPTFSQVVTLLFDAGFSVLLDKKLAPEAFALPPPPAEGNPELSRLRNSKTVLLPKVLSILTRQAHAIGNGMPNEYLQEMESVRELEAFAAVVYSSNWENEIYDEGLMASAVDVSAVAPGPELSVPIQQSQASVGTESIVVVDPSQSSFESAWEKAIEQKGT